MDSFRPASVHLLPPPTDMLPRTVFFALFGWLCAAGFSAAAAAAEPNAKVPADHVERARQGTALFKSVVRELLIKECLDCHGGKAVKADFDLSTREKLVESGMLEETAADSHLFAVVARTAEPFMPLKKEKLAEDKIAVLKKWIDLGAPYDKPLVEGKEATPPMAMVVTDEDRQFWSFRPLASPAVPAVKNEAWSRTAIDRFVLAAQEAKGLHPNAEAARRTLIRRVHFDLLGLPPQPEEVAKFVGDPDPEAYEKLIDRLLESEHYGERWARHWMDVARYAESHGYEQDYDRNSAFHYRNFLIKAFNADMPFNQFVSWQLAGDELAPQDPLALMATGFLGAGAFPTQLTEAEFESARYDELDDMVATTGVAFLGLSVGCARCHDHKFDPIPVKDYYRMAATFSTAIRSELDLDLEPDANRKRQADFLVRQTELKKDLEQYEQNELPAEFREWLTKYDPASETGPWEGLAAPRIAAASKTVFAPQEGGSFLTAAGKAPAKETITIIGESKRQGITALRLEALHHDSLPAKGPGRAGNGNFVLSHITVMAEPLNGIAVAVPLVAARATHQQNTGDLSVAASLDEAPGTGWAVDAGGIGKDQAAVFEFAQPVGFPDGTRLTVTLRMDHPNPQHSLGHFRVSLTTLPKPEPIVGGPMLDPAVREALAAAKANPDATSEAWKTALKWFAPRSPEWAKRSQTLTEHNAKGPQLQMTKVLATTEGRPHLPHHADDRGFPHFYPETFFLKRGDAAQKDGVAPAGMLQVLMPAGTESAQWKVSAPQDWTQTTFRRASLANWMTDPQRGAGNIIARVIVNRLWQHHFGRGIVATPNDFGIQGERPSHPELLEWLASDLVSNGWKLKRLHKLILTSSVYRQDNAFDETRAAIDRENVLLWRRAPQRLEAEPIRDSLLAISGLLDPQMYAAGTLDQNMRRRSVYFQIKRSGLVPMMMLFDWPEHLVSIGQRPTTTIAPQALMFLNSPQGRQYSEAFARRMAAPTPEETVKRGYQFAFGRDPRPEEQAAAVKFLAAQGAQYQAAGQADPESLARTDLAQAIFSLNELVYVD